MLKLLFIHLFMYSRIGIEWGLIRRLMVYYTSLSECIIVYLEVDERRLHLGHPEFVPSVLEVGSECIGFSEGRKIVTFFTWNNIISLAT